MRRDSASDDTSVRPSYPGLLVPILSFLTGSTSNYYFFVLNVNKIRFLFLLLLQLSQKDRTAISDFA